MNAQTKTQNELAADLAAMLPPIAETSNLPAVAKAPAAARAKPEPKHYPPRIAKAMLAVTNAIGVLQKEGFNKFQQYKYTTWEAINDRLSPLLADHGLIIIQAEVSRDLIEQNDKGSTLAIVYEFTIINEHGEQWPPIPWTGFCRLRDQKGITDDKAGPKCATQAEKYFCVKTFKIRTSDAIDNDAGDGEVSSLPKKNSRALYATMQAEIDAARSVVELKTWGAGAIERSKVLPPDWQAHLRLRYNEKLADLEASTQTETWDEETGEITPPTEPKIWGEKVDELPEPQTDDNWWKGQLIDDHTVKWNALTPSQQAGILCNEAAFQQFVSEQSTLPAAEFVRHHCLMRSRADIKANHVSGKLWRELVAAYRAWQALPDITNSAAAQPQPTAADAGASVTPVAEAPALTEAEIAHMTEHAVYKSILYNAATSDASLRAAWKDIPTKWRDDPELIAVKDRLKAGLA